MADPAIIDASHHFCVKYSHLDNYDCSRPRDLSVSVSPIPRRCGYWKRSQDGVDCGEARSTLHSPIAGAAQRQKKKTLICTTRENYQDRLSGFSFHDLPKTFQDAFQVTRALGKNLIWIDALCIIQTVEETEDPDWMFESGRMEDTFNSAYCTIAVDSAADWKQGFLQRSSPPCFTEVTGERVYVCDTRHNFEDDVNNSLLNKRAWVLQERILSRRILHFTKNHTYFACGHGVYSETLRS